jgi:hypothetical protein
LSKTGEAEAVEEGGVVAVPVVEEKKGWGFGATMRGLFGATMPAAEVSVLAPQEGVEAAGGEGGGEEEGDAEKGQEGEGEEQGEGEAEGEGAAALVVSTNLDDSGGDDSIMRRGLAFD